MQNHPQSLVSILRRICTQIEQQFLSHLSSYTNQFNHTPTQTPTPTPTPTRLQSSHSAHILQPHNPKPQFNMSHYHHNKPNKHQQHKLQSLRNAMIQCLTSKLPALISYQQQFNNTLEDTKQIVDNLQRKNNQLTITNKKLTSQHNQMIIDNGLMAIQFTQLRKKYQQSEQQLMTIKQHKQLQKKIINQQKQIVIKQLTTPSQLQLLCYEKQLFTRQLHDTQHTITILRNQIDNITNQYKQLYNINTELQRQFVGQQRRNNMMDKQMINLLNNNQQIKVQWILKTVKLEQKCVRLSEQCQKLQQDLKHILEKYEQMIKQLNNMQEKLKETEDIVTTKQRQIDQLSSKLLSFQHLYTTLLSEYQQLSKQNTQQTSHYHKLQSDYNECKHINQTINEQNYKLITQINRLLEVQDFVRKKSTEERYRLQKEVQQLEKSLQQEKFQQQSKHDKDKENIINIGIMHEEIRKKLETKIVLLERAVKEAKEKNKASKTQIDKLYKVIALYESRQKNSKAKQANLQQTVTDLQTKLQHSKKDNAQSMKTIQQIQQDKKQLLNMVQQQRIQLNNILVKYKGNCKSLQNIQIMTHQLKLTYLDICTKIKTVMQQLSVYMVKLIIVDILPFLNQIINRHLQELQTIKEKQRQDQTDLKQLQIVETVLRKDNLQLQETNEKQRRQIEQGLLEMIQKDKSINELIIIRNTQQKQINQLKQLLKEKTKAIDCLLFDKQSLRKQLSNFDIKAADKQSRKIKLKYSPISSHEHTFQASLNYQSQNQDKQRTFNHLSHHDHDNEQLLEVCSRSQLQKKRMKAVQKQYDNSLRKLF